MHIENTVDGSAIGTLIATRGGYDEITALEGMDSSRMEPQMIISRYKEALPETFVAFDAKQRGDALNLDLYGYDEVQDVAVIQVRHAFRRYRNGFMNVRKDYVLVGFNEITEAAFRHPVSAQSVRAAIRAASASPKSAVRGAQRWMWGVTDKQLDTGMHQGDVLLVKERGRPKGELLEDTEATVAGSHLVTARSFIRGQKHLFALDPAVYHTKGQYDAIYADSDGWYSVRVADETTPCDWSIRLGD
jgi:hypothetical protein